MSLNGGVFVDQHHMEYSNQLRSPTSSTGDSYDDNITRPRFHTWPTSNFYGQSYQTPYTDETQSGYDNHVEMKFDKNILNKQQTHEKSPPAQQQSPRSQPRRKLTTHKLSAKSYVDLITEAITSTLEKRMTLADIYKWMVANVPCFKQQANVSASSGWKNAVRHTLSLHKRFKRVQRGRLQKPAWWTIQDQEGGFTGTMSTVAGRSPNSTVSHYARRHSETCFNEMRSEIPVSPSKTRGNNSNANFQLPELARDWQSSTVTAAAAAAVAAVGIYNNFAANISNWEMGPYESLSPVPQATQQSTVLGIPVVQEDDYSTDLAFESHMTRGGGGYLTRTTSDASSYGASPYRLKTLVDAYTSLNQVEECKPMSKTYETTQDYNDQEINDQGDPSTVDMQQSLMVKCNNVFTQISVPMPLRLDAEQQKNEHTETVGYTYDDTPKQHTMDYAYKMYSYLNRDPALPQDLLGIQVDSQVQCNVAEVLAYEMKAQTGGNEIHGVNDLYDLLRAGCALD